MLLISLELLLIEKAKSAPLAEAWKARTLAEKLIMVFWLLSGISTLLSVDRGISFWGSNRCEGFLTLTLYCATFFLVAKHAEPKKLYLWVFGVSISLACILSIIQLFGANPLGLYPAGMNYYDGGKEIRIPLDEQLTASKNAKKYYDRYAKLKRTEEAVTEELEKTRSENAHLASILTSLDLATEESDLNQIREELADYKFIRRHVVKGKKQKIVSKPLHFVSSDGFDIYVGKNNYQNEEITFRIASGSDWWFHAKKMPGSHVIVKCDGRELPDRTFEEAGALAAWYSGGRNADKVEVDYIQRRYLRKVTGAAPGFVIYHTNYSLMAVPEIRVQEYKEPAR
jgi:hypothetical protein